MNERDYYVPPSDEIFEEVKEKALELWGDIATDPSYLEEKVLRVQPLANVQDNVMYIVAMFDINNQARLAQSLSAEGCAAIRHRMLAGGNPTYLIPF